MSGIYQEYTLKRHLKELCEVNEKYSFLYTSLSLDIEKIQKYLNQITYNMPHYSDHSIEHSENIIEKIEMLLGENRIKKLHPTDTWLLLMACYTHDLGMVVLHNKLEKEWEKDEFQDFLKETARYSFDKDLEEACNYILKFNQRDVEDNKWPISVRKKLNLIVAEFFRKRHALNSSEVIKNTVLDVSDLNLTISSRIERRIINLLGDIANAHSLNFNEVMEKFPYDSIGCGGDVIHPRFIAMLLRVGDLLDLDNGRFDLHTEKVAGDLPKISKCHKEKHDSISHFLITPQKIEVSADCPSDESYRELLNWLDWLEEELKNLSINWNEISPENFDSPPSMRKKEIYISGKNKQANLKFHFDMRKAFEIIEGSGIYNDDFIFIRELIQNALDTTKIRIWSDIKSGLYDGILSNKLKCMPSEIEGRLTQSFEFPKIILENYPINIRLYEEEGLNNNYDLVFQIEDNGVGIDIFDLEKISNVGQSYKQNKKLKKFIEKMPFYLKPTAAFGLGLQSCFMVTDRVVVESKKVDKTLEIQMETRKNNGYLSYKELNKYRKKGSLFKIKIKKNILEKKLKNQISEKHDFFSQDNPYFNYLEKKIIDEIKGIKFFKFDNVFERKDYYNGNQHFYIPFLLKSRENKEEEKPLKIDKNIFIYAKKDDLGNLYHEISIFNEKRKALVHLFTSHDHESRVLLNKCFVKGINVKDLNLNFWGFISKSIDLFDVNVENDLNISRNNPVKITEFNDMLKGIFQESLKIFFNKIKENKVLFSLNLNDDLKMIYEVLYQMVFGSSQDHFIKKEDFKNLDDISSEILYGNPRNVVSYHRNGSSYFSTKEEQDKIEKKVEEYIIRNHSFFNNTGFILINFNLNPKLRELVENNYKRRGFESVNNDLFCDIFEKKENLFSDFTLEIGQLKYHKKNWADTSKFSKAFRPKHKKRLDTDKEFNFLCDKDSMIYSPINLELDKDGNAKISDEKITSIIFENKKNSKSWSEDNLKDSIEEKIESLVPKSIVEHIIENPLKGNPTEKDIYTAYINLIFKIYRDYQGPLLHQTNYKIVTVKGSFSKELLLSSHYYWSGKVSKHLSLSNENFIFLEDEKGNRIKINGKEEIIIEKNKFENDLRIVFREDMKKLFLFDGNENILEGK